MHTLIGVSCLVARAHLDLIEPSNIEKSNILIGINELFNETPYTH